METFRKFLNTLLGEEMKSDLFGALEGGFNAALQGVGLNELSWSLKDQTAFGASRLVEVQLQLIFADPSIAGIEFRTVDVMHNASDPDATFRYVDLIRRTNEIRDKSSHSSGDSYETYSLRLDIGYAPPAPNAIAGIATGDLSQEFVEGVTSSAASVNNISLLLELQDYDLQIVENGQMQLTLNYFSWIERQSETADYNMFGNFNVPYTTKEIAEKAKSSPLSQKRANSGKIEGISKAENRSFRVAKSGTNVAVEKERQQELDLEPSSAAAFADASGMGFDGDDIAYQNQMSVINNQLKDLADQLEKVNATLKEVEGEIEIFKKKLIYANKISRYNRVMKPS